LAGYQEGVAYAPSVEESLEAIRAWENMIRVWEGDEGEMVDYAEGSLVHRKRNEVRNSVGGRDEPLQQLVRERGYTQDTENPEGHSSFLISGPPEPQLPPGFFFRTMADSNDIELRREVFGRAFNHPDPRDWPSAFAYEELQRAPDYRKDLDLYIVGPGGQYVACCIVQYDERNRVGMLEPVGTHPDFRRRGLGRAVVLEGIQRAALLGAQRVNVGADVEFYLAIGFERTHVAHIWTKPAAAKR